jgi:hypothetical protein
MRGRISDKVKVSRQDRLKAVFRITRIMCGIMKGRERKQRRRETHACQGSVAEDAGRPVLNARKRP